MSNAYITLLGKAVRRIALMRGGGSALPGLFVEKVAPGFVGEALAGLPKGIVVVSGTNGKTTTTKIVVELLESQGLTVFTNRTGSNFVRGVAAALLGEVDNHGRLKADIAVLELDEAHAVHFVKTISPRYCLLLNVMRDQLDRFGEIDTTARLLQQVAEQTSDVIVLNRDDPRLGSSSFIRKLEHATIKGYGVHPDLQRQFPSDDDMRSTEVAIRTPVLLADDTSLEKLTSNGAEIAWGGKDHSISLELSGIYNILNATGAIALVRAIMDEELDERKMLAALTKVKPAFGRGELIHINGQPCELVLVKNPAGFRLSLQSFDPRGVATMIAINDHNADGRDMSWLWDVDFDSLKPEGVACVSGIRAYDMALRLQYDEIKLHDVMTNLDAGLEKLLNEYSNQPKRIFCTYTAMLHLRKQLGKQEKLMEVRA